MVVAPLWSVDFLAEGEKQLGLNNPKKALTYLEAALAQGTPSEKLYLELGLAYTRLDMAADAQNAFALGAELGGDSRQTLLFNLGVALTRSKDFSGAEATYSTLLGEAPQLGDAWLNRANVRVQLAHYDTSVEDYKQYQTLVPENPQKDKIDKLISLLENAAMEAKAVELADQTRKAREAEAQKATEAKAAALKQEDDQKASVAAAEAAQKAEAAKQEADRVAAEEQSRQDAILAQIRATLAGASADAKSLATGPAGVKSDESDFALEP
jgi:tetratricopeptide (TPR) repeat protein